MPRPQQGRAPRTLSPRTVLSQLWGSQSPLPRVECCESHLSHQGWQLHHSCSVGWNSFSRVTQADTRVDLQKVTAGTRSSPSFSCLYKPYGIPPILPLLAIFRRNITPLFPRYQIIDLPKKTSYASH